MDSWLNWCIALIQTCVQWLSTTEVFGVPLLGIMAATAIIPVILSITIYRG